MSLIKQSILLGVLGAVGFGAGDWWGGESQQKSAATALNPEAPFTVIPAPPVPVLTPVSLMDAEQHFLTQAQMAKPEQWPELWRLAAAMPEHRLLLAQAWSKLNPSTFLRCLQQSLRPGDETGIRARNILFHQWASLDPQAALHAALEVIELPSFSGSAREVVQEVMLTDLKQAIQLTTQLPVNYYRWKLPPASYESDPASCLTLLLPLENLSSAWTEGVNDILTHWASKDLNALSSWLAKHTAWKSRLLPQVITQMAKVDPAGVGAAIAQMETGKSREYYAKNFLLKQWSQQNPEAALRWAQENLLDGQDFAVTDILTRLAVQDRPKANSLAGNLRPGKTRDKAIEDLAAAWANKEPLQAAAWVRSLPQDYARERGLNRISHDWIKADLAGVAQFVLEDPAGPPAMGQLVVEKLSETDPAGAIKFISKLSPDYRFLISHPAYQIVVKDGVSAAMKFVTWFADPQLEQDMIRTLLRPYRHRVRPLDEAITWAKGLRRRELIQNAKAELLDTDNLSDTEEKHIETSIR